MAPSYFNIRFLVILTAIVAIRSPIRLVRCDDEVSAKKVVDIIDAPAPSDSPVEDLNIMHLLANRQSDVRIRSVLPNTEKDSEPAFAEKVSSESPPVSESTLTNILLAAENLSSLKCTEHIREMVAGIRRGHHWALASKL